MGSPVRVLHVVVNMNRGGAETLLMNLYRNMDRSVVQFDFLTCKEGVFDEEIQNLGGRIYRIPYISESGPLAYRKALERFFKEHSRYRIVHSHLDKMSGIVLKSAEKASIPIRIAHSHNTQSEGRFPSRAYKWYAGQLIGAASTHQYACSYAAAKWLFGKKAKKAIVLKNGIELENFMFSREAGLKIREELNINQDALVLGHVGRFSPQKNHSFLLDVFTTTLDKLPHAVLILAGDGPLRKNIEEKVKEQKLTDKVKIVGVRDDVDQLMQAFDLFIFPSLHEGLPVTLIEAQGAGLPCIVADTITPEVDMGMGLLHRRSLQEKNGWQEKILEMAEKPPERETGYRKLIENGYDIKKTAETMQTSYLSLGREA